MSFLERDDLLSKMKTELFCRGIKLPQEKQVLQRITFAIYHMVQETNNLLLD